MEQVNILIVEDEVMIAEDMSYRISDMGYAVKGIASSYDAAIEIIKNEPIDLALLDISIDGAKTGIDIAEYINENHLIPFIFLSSLANQNVINQVKAVNPSAYLLKPFNDRQVKVSIDLALSNFSQSKTGQECIEDVKESDELWLLKMPNHLFLKKGHNYKKIEYQHILWLEAESNYTIINTTCGVFTYSCTLKHFEDKLPHDHFIRVHRSFIINFTAISGFEGNMILIGEQRIPVNKANRDKVFKHFNVL